MGGGSRADRLDRTLDRHGDALFDFALTVTGDPERATEAVCQAVPAAVGAGGPFVGRAALLGAVLDAALRRATPPAIKRQELFGPGPGSRDDLQHLAQAATQALYPRQRGVLDLALRRGLDGEALSEALGVSPGQVSVKTQAAVDEAEQVVGAVLLARLGQSDCQDLVHTIHDPTQNDCGRRAALAVSQHLEQCPTCADRRRALVPVTSLLASIPVTPAPPELRRRLLQGPSIGPSPVEPHRGLHRPASWGTSPGARRGRLPSGRARGALAAGLVAAVIAASVGLALVARRRPNQPAGPPLAGRLALGTEPLDFGPGDEESSFVVANTGRESLHFTVQPGAPWLRAMDREGTLAPGQVFVVFVAVDRGSAPEGDATSEFRVQSTGGSGVVAVRAGVERPPVFSTLEAIPPSIVQTGCPGSTPAQVRTMVVEESGVGHVELHWRGPGGPEQVGEMAGDGAYFVGSFGPFPTMGDVEYWVSATDVRGNSTTSPPESLRVSGC